MNRPVVARCVCWLLVVSTACGSHEPSHDAPPASVTAAVADSRARTPEPAPEPSATSARPPGDMALVPAGSFTMGSDTGGELDEHPAHTVTLAAFFLDRTEVTNEAYARCVQAGPCAALDGMSANHNGFGSDAPFRRPEQPVSAVGWNDAKAYCTWAKKRLPTEAEWERAARSDDKRVFPWGNEAPAAARAVFGGALTADVGTHPAGDGPYGHHDLAGNVWEWVQDIYDPCAYTRKGAETGRLSTCEEALEALDELRRTHKRGFTGSNPIPTECEHVLRGGAFNYPDAGLRVTNRAHHPARMRLVMAGFRCARDAK